MHNLSNLDLAAIITGALLIGATLGIAAMALLVINRDKPSYKDSERIAFLEAYGLGLHPEIMAGSPCWSVVDVEGKRYGPRNERIGDAIDIASILRA